MLDSNYNLLPIKEKVEMLWSKGKFIDAIELNEYDIFLYSLNDQLIEIYISIDNNRIEKVSVLNDTDRLNLYNIDQKMNLELV